MNIEAPYRGFIQQRQWEQERNKEQQVQTGEMVLFFGCRYKDRDYLYGEWLQQLHDQKKITLFSAFSREKKDKFYVQHLVKKQSDLIWDLLSNKNACIYICGDAKNMESDVRNAIVEIISFQDKLDLNEAQSYLHNLEKIKRFQKDTWF